MGRGCRWELSSRNPVPGNGASVAFDVEGDVVVPPMQNPIRPRIRQLQGAGRGVRPKEQGSRRALVSWDMGGPGRQRRRAWRWHSLPQHRQERQGVSRNRRDTLVWVPPVGRRWVATTRGASWEAAAGRRPCVSRPRGEGSLARALGAGHCWARGRPIGVRQGWSSRWRQGRAGSHARPGDGTPGQRGRQQGWWATWEATAGEGPRVPGQCGEGGLSTALGAGHCWAHGMLRRRQHGERE